jgi:phosphate acetyltransferase
MTNALIRSEENPFYHKLVGQPSDVRPLRTAVVSPTDASSLGGAMVAAERGFIVPILIGVPEQIQAAATEGDYQLDGYEIIPAATPEMAAETAVSLAAEHKADAIMKGHIHTDEFMLPIVGHGSPLRTKRRMSHVFVVDVPEYPKPLLLTDAAVNIRPNLKQKRDIVQNAVDLFHALALGDLPKVAILSATEQVTEELPSTLHAAGLCKMAERGKITGCLIDGPLAFDNAISKEAARAKGIRSDVAGDADILVVPDLEAGNMLYKQMRYLCGYNAAGIVVGATVPIILTSRAARPMSRLASTALAVMYAHGQKAALRVST